MCACACACACVCVHVLLCDQGSRVGPSFHYLDDIPSEWSARTSSFVKEIFASFEVRERRSDVCVEEVTQPTVFVVRVEYTNVFHQSTDWYSVYQAVQTLGLHDPGVVFLDAHPATPLDDVWRRLFTSVRFVKHLSGPTCFRRAVFVPYGCDVGTLCRVRS